MKKTFKFGEKVRITLPNTPPFTGTVYSEYTSPGMMRRICVTHLNGCGVAYPVKYVNKVRRKS